MHQSVLKLALKVEWTRPIDGYDIFLLKSATHSGLRYGLSDFIRSLHVSLNVHTDLAPDLSSWLLQQSGNPTGENGAFLHPGVADNQGVVRLWFDIRSQLGIYSYVLTVETDDGRLSYPFTKAEVMALSDEVLSYFS